MDRVTRRRARTPRAGREPSTAATAARSTAQISSSGAPDEVRPVLTVLITTASVVAIEMVPRPVATGAAARADTASRSSRRRPCVVVGYRSIAMSVLSRVSGSATRGPGPDLVSAADPTRWAPPASGAWARRILDPAPRRGSGAVAVRVRLPLPARAGAAVRRVPVGGFRCGALVLPAGVGPSSVPGSRLPAAGRGL
jgi:hypothetical protein